jgi:hypothetical protein
MDFQVKVKAVMTEGMSYGHLADVEHTQKRIRFQVLKVRAASLELTIVDSGLEGGLPKWATDNPSAHQDTDTRFKLGLKFRNWNEVSIVINRRLSPYRGDKLDTASSDCTSKFHFCSPG